MKMAPDTCVARGSKIAQRLFEERMLVITAEDSMLHRLNEVGTFLWQCLDAPRTVRELCDRVRDAFDEADGDLDGEVGEFIGELVDKGLVEVRE